MTQHKNLMIYMRLSAWISVSLCVTQPVCLCVIMASCARITLLTFFHMTLSTHLQGTLLSEVFVKNTGVHFSPVSSLDMVVETDS